MLKNQNIHKLNSAYFQLGILFIAFAVLYLPFLQTMVKDWGENDNYSHGYLIPFIFGFMIYSMRDQLGKIEISPSNWGMLVIVIGLCQLMVAKIGMEYFLQRTSIIVVFFGISLYLFGSKMTKKVSLPLLYLIFMIPIPAIIWNRVAFPMQLFASSITETIIHAISIPVYREGNVIHLTETTLEVVDACSGLRSLISLFALSGAFTFMVKLSTVKKWILFFSAAPIAIVVNITRLVSTAILAKWMGADAAQGFLHDFSGMVVFVGGIFLLYCVSVLLSKLGSAHP